MYTWFKVDVGWYTLAPAGSGGDGDVFAAVCQELAEDVPDRCKRWCLYIDKIGMPGDAQFRTLREAKAAAVSKLKGERKHGEASS